MTASANDLAFEEMDAEWKAIQTREVAHWETIFKEMRAEQLGHIKRGQWVGGPPDLLGIIGKGRWETFHSAVVAWLLNPNGKHYLGPTFLEMLLDKSHPDHGLSVEDLAPCSSAVEVEAASSRADIVVSGPDLHLVIEVKVDAQEGPNQCQRQFNDHNGPDSLFVFLTPRGVRPRSCTGDVQSSWGILSFTWIRDTLGELLQSHADLLAQDQGAQATIRSYLSTLRREF